MPDNPRTYVVKQMVSDHRGDRNESVETLEDLVTHHPRSNRHIRMQDGEIVQAEDMRPGYRGGNRSYAFIGGEFQEVIDAQSDRYGNLRPDQVLMSKDFILEDPRPSQGRAAREVDVPSPIDGYVNAVNRNAGFVEIMDRQGGDVIARIRHLSDMTVEPGDTVFYGQSLGTQNNSGLNLPAGRAIHVHLDMDTRYYQQYQNYIDDLSTGRLPVQAEFREGIAARPVVDDGVARLGEASERVRQVQLALTADGYRAIDERPIVVDGVYRPNIQGAVIAFQQDHGLLQTGDIDLATWQQANVINQRANAPADAARAELLAPAHGILRAIQDPMAEPLAPGDPRYGLLPPSDPSRSGRAPQWEAHADHVQDRERAVQPQILPLPAAPRQEPPQPDGRGQPDAVRGLQDRNGAVMLDNPAHEDYGMFAMALSIVHARDKALQREPDEISRQLAGGLVEKARERGLETIAAAKFTPDGMKVGMSDTANLSAEWARTAVGDVRELAGQKLSQSSENVAAINQQQTLEQSLRQPSQTQAMQGQDDVATRAPRIA